MPITGVRPHLADATSLSSRRARAALSAPSRSICACFAYSISLASRSCASKAAMSCKTTQSGRCVTGAKLEKEVATSQPTSPLQHPGALAAAGKNGDGRTIVWASGAAAHPTQHQPGQHTNNCARAKARPPAGSAAPAAVRPAQPPPPGPPLQPPGLRRARPLHYLRCAGRAPAPPSGLRFPVRGVRCKGCAEGGKEGQAPGTTVAGASLACVWRHAHLNTASSACAQQMGSGRHVSLAPACRRMMEAAQGRTLPSESYVVLHAHWENAEHRRLAHLPRRCQLLMHRPASEARCPPCAGPLPREA